jgi:hypothetical protein
MVEAILNAVLAYSLWIATLVETSSIPREFHAASFIWLCWSPFIAIAAMSALWSWRQDRRAMRRYRL